MTFTCHKYGKFINNYLIIINLFIFFSYLVIKRKSAPLERLLLKKCEEDTSIFIKINWLFESFGEANKEVPKNYEKV